MTKGLPLFKRITILTHRSNGSVEKTESLTHACYEISGTHLRVFNSEGGIILLDAKCKMDRCNVDNGELVVDYYREGVPDGTDTK